MTREPDKLIFINYALKMPEYEFLSNLSCITAVVSQCT